MDRATDARRYPGAGAQPVLAHALFSPVSNNRQKVLRTMDWVPVVFIVFKVLVFGTCMFFAIKWHYDQGKKKK